MRDDRKRLYSQLSSGHIFGTFSESEREQIWERVCIVSQECLIPTLFTFFEDMKFLGSAVACMRRLMHLSKGDSRHQASQAVVCRLEPKDRPMRDPGFQYYLRGGSG